MRCIFSLETCGEARHEVTRVSGDGEGTVDLCEDHFKQVAVGMAEGFRIGPGTKAVEFFDHFGVTPQSQGLPAWRARCLASGRRP